MPIRIPAAVPPFQADVAFVDDEQAVLDGLRRALIQEGVGWNMSFFDNPRAALESAELLSCTVIVSDLRMPELSGLHLLERLRARGAMAQSIILTGTGDMGSALEAINSLRVFRYYTKPCPPSRLIEGISDAIRHRQDVGLPKAVTDRLAVGILAVDSSKRIVFMNRVGGRLVAGGDVIVTDAAGRCRGGTPQQSAALHRCLGEVMRTGEPAIMVMTNAAGERRYSVLIDRGGMGHSESVLLFVRDIDRHPVPSEDVLRRLFDFSGSEAKLAHGLASGQDLKEVAETMGVTIQTARTYLKNLFGKTGTNRQAELVRVLIMAAPPVWSADDPAAPS